MRCASGFLEALPGDWALFALGSLRQICCCCPGAHPLFGAPRRFQVRGPYRRSRDTEASTKAAFGLSLFAAAVFDAVSRETRSPPMSLMSGMMLDRTGRSETSADILRCRSSLKVPKSLQARCAVASMDRWITFLRSAGNVAVPPRIGLAYKRAGRG